MSTLNFVTLFNSNYLSRGMVLYESLQKHCPDFKLFVIAFDDITYNYFQKFPQKNLTVISLSQFEDDKLLATQNILNSSMDKEVKLKFIGDILTRLKIKRLAIAKKILEELY